MRGPPFRVDEAWFAARKGRFPAGQRGIPHSCAASFNVSEGLPEFFVNFEGPPRVG
jgi:hypothetical protein